MILGILNPWVWILLPVIVGIIADDRGWRKGYHAGKNAAIREIRICPATRVDGDRRCHYAKGHGGPHRDSKGGWNHPHELDPIDIRNQVTVYGDPYLSPHQTNPTAR